MENSYFTIEKIDWDKISESEFKYIEWEKLWEEGESCADPAPEMKPYPNEHACRVRDPADFQRGSFRRTKRRADKRTLWLIIGKLKGEAATTLQAFRYPKDEWSAPDARRHCKRHKGIRFEPARSTSKDFDIMFAGFSVDDVLNNLWNTGKFNLFAEIKSVDKDERIIKGYANTSNLDRVGDIIDPSAFRSSLSYFKKHGKILMHHNPTLPVGKPIDANIDDKGLFIVGQIAKGLTPMSYIEESWSLIDQGVLDAFSIGFCILKDETQEDKDGRKYRKITKLDLYECSIVSIPANTAAHFSVVKALLNAGKDANNKGEEGNYIKLKRYLEQLKDEIEELEFEAQIEATSMKIKQLQGKLLQ